MTRGVWVVSTVSLALALLAPTLSAGAATGGGYVRPGQTQMLSVTPNGGASSTLVDEYGQEQSPPAISGNGRYVAFPSSAYDLVKWQTDPPGIDIFRRDMSSGRTEYVDVSSSGQHAVNPPASTRCCVGGPPQASISANGRLVAFDSQAPNLVPGDTNICARFYPMVQQGGVTVQSRGPCSDVFVRNMETGKTTRVSVSSNGTQANDASFWPAISADGRYVAFESGASNLVKGDTNGVDDVFVRDLQAHKTVRVSVSSRGVQGNGNSQGPSISATGRFVAFFSSATNLIPSDANGTNQDVLVYDSKSKKLELDSIASTGTQADSWSEWPSISGTGRYVAFDSNASNLAPLGNGAAEVYVHDRVTRRTRRASVTSDGELGDYESRRASLSADGRFVGFQTNSTNFYPGFDQQQPFLPGLQPPDENVFLHDTLTDATTFVSIDAHNRWPAGFVMSMFPAMSATGRFIAYGSTAIGLVRGDRRTPADSSRQWQTYLRDQGPTLGVGTLGGSPPSSSQGNEICLPGAICVPQPCVATVCVPAQAALSVGDPSGDVRGALDTAGANLVGASLAYRSRSRDLFARLEVRDMPSVAGTPLAGAPGILYGLRFTALGHRYEVRAQRVPGPDFDQAGGASFGLFERDPMTGLYVRTATLRGGFGTTGYEVVFAVPLGDVGLEHGGRLTHVEAFTALGSFDTGPIRILDTARL